MIMDLMHTFMQKSTIIDKKERNSIRVYNMLYLKMKMNINCLAKGVENHK